MAVWTFLRFHLRRAFAWDLALIPLSPAEKNRLTSRGITDATAQRYLAWRRSLLMVLVAPAVLTTALYQYDALDNDFDRLTDLGLGVVVAAMLSLYLLPLAAIAALVLWPRPRPSRRVLRHAWVVAFLTPIATTVFPIDWLISVDAIGTGEHATPFERFLKVLLDEFGGQHGSRGKQQVARAVVGIEYFVDAALMVVLVLLALVPGTLRAGVRVKALLPHQTMIGWFLVAAPLVSSLLVLPLFIAVNQIASDPLLITGTTLLMAAPWVFVAYTRLFARPWKSPDDRRKVGRAQGLAMALMGLAWSLLLTYAATRKVPIVDKTLLGLHDESSLLRPWDWRIIRVLIEYTSRALYTTVVVADLLLVVGLSVWHDTVQSVKEGPPGGQEELMSQIIGNRRSSP